MATDQPESATKGQLGTTQRPSEDRAGKNKTNIGEEERRKERREREGGELDKSLKREQKKATGNNKLYTELGRRIERQAARRKMSGEQSEGESARVQKRGARAVQKRKMGT